MTPDDADPVEVPITGDLDLHTFHPRDLGVLLPEYLRECGVRNIPEVRVIHGKGTGALRTGVHKLLERLQRSGAVLSFHWPAPESAGGWGATLVRVPVCGNARAAPAPQDSTDSSSC